MVDNFAKPPYLCSRCGRRLKRIVGPAGFFWGCSYYPRCRRTFADVQGKPWIRQKLDYSCPKCAQGTLNRKKCINGYIWICNASICHAKFANKKNKPNTESV